MKKTRKEDSPVGLRKEMLDRELEIAAEEANLFKTPEKIVNINDNSLR